MRRLTFAYRRADEMLAKVNTYAGASG